MLQTKSSSEYVKGIPTTLLLQYISQCRHHYQGQTLSKRLVREPSTYHSTGTYHTPAPVYLSVSSPLPRSDSLQTTCTRTKYLPQYRNLPHSCSSISLSVVTITKVRLSPNDLYGNQLYLLPFCKGFMTFGFVCKTSTLYMHHRYMYTK